MRSAVLLLFLALHILWGAIVAYFLRVNDPKQPKQQFVYQEQVTMPNGDRAAIFIPDKPVALGVQLRSGSSVMVIGEVVTCRPFVEYESIGGDRTVSRQLLNCGPRSPGQPDRILTVAGIQWR